MTQPSPETLDRETDKLWLTDAELIRRMGVPEKLGRAILRQMNEPGTGFPKKQELYGDRRYWPAVKDYFDSRFKATMDAPQERKYQGRRV